ncbi:type IV secretory system conjugative DNA transfer family protein [Streptomyces sp. ISL-94]|uniref:type IV secretory system conjugative DNA transfer family protein n=1 Tax=Streptomyces sp. ISL-94 TaxID=2819190 RepID=UPI001BE70829|nr:type IV secretory system conjugative DNA transfer family protein [Streptomyces sp. ISL-94]MBT2481071.1 type VI secretion protein [Streptomyces sp. ISL-94]
MHDARRTQTPARGGIPDGLLVGLLAFLLGLAVLIWSATGLAALFSKGSWPATVTFTRTPGAVRALIAQPHDVAGAWPDTDPAALPGWGLFWGLFISQLLVLFVLTVFAIGVIARTKSRRALARQAAALAPVRPEPPAVPAQAPVPAPAPAPAQLATAPAGPAQPQTPAPGADRTPPPADEAYRYGFGYAPTAAGASGAPAAPAAPAPGIAAAPQRLAYAGPYDRFRAAVARIGDTEGAALIVTSSPTLWAETKDARAKLGPVLLYDPSHLCDTPARMHWNPTDGCADRDTAAARAIALLAPVRPQARMDAAVADTAETLLRSWLQAAALDDRPFKQLHRWTQGNNAQDPVRILRTHPQAAPGSAGELESALTAHAERRELAQNLTARALSCLTSIHIREACNPNRTDALTLASFTAEGGTLYMVGEALEDPRTHPGAMPLLTALAAHVVEHGRRMAARSSHGRLDPPLSLILDDVAAVAPIPQLPELLQDETLPLLALCRSREQARSRWPQADLP